MASSTILVILSIAVIATKGFNYGIDFLGGTELQFQFSEQVDVEDIRESLQAIEMQDALVQAFGNSSDNEFLIRVPSASVDLNRFENEIKQGFESEPLQGQKVTSFEVRGDSLYLGLSGSVEVEALLAKLKSLGKGKFEVISAAAFGKESEHKYLMRFSGITKQITTALEKNLWR